MNSRRLIEYVENTALTIGFCSALWAPMLGMIFGVGQITSAEENRTLARLPTVTRNVSTWIAFSEDYKQYFHDHFGFRRTLVQLQASVKREVLGISSSPDVVVGKGEWLFYAGYHALDNYRNIHPLTEQKLGAWARFVAARREFLTKRDTPFFVIIVPEKHSIYSEYIPMRFTRLGHLSRLDQLVAYFRQHSTIPLIDIRGALLQAKARNRLLYRRTDTHWNAYGAYVGYLQLMAALTPAFPTLRPVAESEVQVVRSWRLGDLARMLGDASLLENGDDVLPSPLVTEILDGPNRVISIRSGGEVLPTLVMFCDSFGNALRKLLSRHFRRGVYERAPNYFDRDLIDREKPDVVVLEMVERALMSPAPSDPRFGLEVNSAERNAANDSSTAAPEGSAGKAGGGQR